MPELILRNIDSAVLQRVRHWADAQNCSLDAAVAWLLDRGLAASAEVGDLEEFDARILAEAISALESVPSDPGFALIGRATPRPPPVHQAPDQSVASTWALPNQ